MRIASKLDSPINFATLSKPRPSLWQAISWPYVITIVLLATIITCSPNFKPVSSPTASPFAGDFLQEWIAGHLLRDGEIHRFYDPEYAKEWEHRTDLVRLEWKPDEYFPMVYPPFYYALVSPLSYLPFITAAFIWLTLMIFAYLAAWQIFIRWAGSHQYHPTFSQGHPQTILWMLPLSLLFVPLIESITSCQKGTVLLLILTMTYSLLVRGQSFSAGLVFGLIAFKPQFALPIAVAMLCKQQWRFVFGGLTTGLLLGGVCLWQGVDLCSQYIAFSRHATDYIQNGGYDLTKSHAFYGFFTLLAGQGQVTLLVKLLTLFAMLGTLALLAFSLRGPLQPQHARFENHFSLLVLSTILLSPHVYTYDLTMLLLPLGFIAQQAFHSRPLQQSTPILTWLALFLFVTAGLSPQLAAITGIQVTVLLMVAMMVVLSRHHGDCSSQIVVGTFT